MNVLTDAYKKRLRVITPRQNRSEFDSTITISIALWFALLNLLIINWSESGYILKVLPLLKIFELEVIPIDGSLISGEGSLAASKCIPSGLAKKTPFVELMVATFSSSLIAAKSMIRTYLSNQFSLLEFDER